MNCKEAHMYLLNEDNQVLCPFCDEQLAETEITETRCCNQPNVIIDSFKIVCTDCGSVHGYKSASEFVDFYDNVYRTRIAERRFLTGLQRGYFL